MANKFEPMSSASSNLLTTSPMMTSSTRDRRKSLASTTKMTKHVQKTSTAVPELHLPKNPGLIGLKNLGNTCYMNAALQALSNCPLLTDFFIENIHQMRKPGLARCFALLVHRIWIGDADPAVVAHLVESQLQMRQNSKIIYYTYLIPDDILHGVKMVCPTFRSYFQQQDAQEFLRCFLNQIHEELKVRIQDEECEEEQNHVEENIWADKQHSMLVDRNAILLAHSDASFRPNHNFSGLNIVDMSVVNRANHMNSSNYNSNLLANGFIPSPTNEFDPTLSLSRSAPPFHNSYIYTNGSANSLSSLTRRTSNESLHCALDQGGDRLSRSPTHIRRASTGGELLSTTTLNHRSSSSDQLNRLSPSAINSLPLSSIIMDSSPPVRLINNISSFSQHSYSTAGSSSSVAKPVSKNTKFRSIISDLFDGQLISSVQCLTCRNVSTVKETFQDLSLPIPNKEYLLELKKHRSTSEFALKVSTFRNLGNKSINSTVTSGGESISSSSASSFRFREEDEYSEQSSLLSTTRRHRSRRFRLGSIKSWLFSMRFVYFLLFYLDRIGRMVVSMVSKALKWFSNWAWGPKISLDDCLSAFFSTDELKGSNRYSCDTCKRLRNGIKYANILEPPELLCIHLKRFKHELMYTSKISNFVSFPLQALDLSAYVHRGNVPSSSTSSFSPSSSFIQNTTTTSLINDSRSFLSNCSNNLKNQKRPLYDLVSLVCHHGNYSSGHYTTYALNRKHNTWYVYDDKIVRPVDESTVARSEAYVLFYKRRQETVDSSPDFDRYSDDSEFSDNESEQDAAEGGGHSKSSSSTDMLMQVLRKAFKEPNSTALPSQQQLRRRRYARPTDQSLLLDASNDILDDIQI